MPKAVLEIRSLARAHTRKAITVLTSIMNQRDAPAAARVVAANSLLDRGWGKAQQDVMVNGDIKITIRKMLEDDGELIDVTPTVLEIDGGSK